MSPATAFVIDDDPGVRASIGGLKSAGLADECFETAEKFLEKEPSDGPCCRILDVSLPKIDGLDFRQKLRNTGRQIPIILITGHGDISKPRRSCPEQPDCHHGPGTGLGESFLT